MPRTTPSWTLIAQALRHSVTPKCLALALAGLLLTTLGWRIAGLVPQPDAVSSLASRQRDFHDNISQWPASRTRMTPLGKFVSRTRIGPASYESSVPRRSAAPPIDPIFGVATRLVEPFLRLFTIGQSWQAIFYYLCGGLLTVLVWAFFGVAISRSAVVACALNQPVSLQDAIEFSAKRAGAVFSAATLPLLAIAMLATPFVVLGWFMTLDIGVVFAGLLWLGVLLAGCLMATLSFGLLGGWPLMWAAVAAENSDAFDAISRSYAYTLQRPLPYLAYVLLAGCMAALGWLVAWWFSETVIHMSYWSVQFGCGAQRVELLRQQLGAPDVSPGLSPLQSVGAGLLQLSDGVVRSAASAYSFSVFWCVFAAIYLLVRNDTDHTELDDIAFETAESRNGPSSGEPDGAPTDESHSP